MSKQDNLRYGLPVEDVVNQNGLLHEIASITGITDSERLLKLIKVLSRYESSIINKLEFSDN
jgi:hypothetical protein